MDTEDDKLITWNTENIVRTRPMICACDGHASHGHILSSSPFGSCRLVSFFTNFTFFSIHFHYICIPHLLANHLLQQMNLILFMNRPQSHSQGSANSLLILTRDLPPTMSMITIWAITPQIVNQVSEPWAWDS